MSWHCSQALVAEYWAACCSDGAQSAQWNVTPMSETFYWPDRTMEHSRLSRFGMTCELLTADHGAALLTWYRAGFPARISAVLESAQELMESTADCGLKWPASLARFDLDLCLWKTAQLSLFEEWAEYSETWPRWGLMRNGECWGLPTPVHSISVTESGSLPTPRKQIEDRTITQRADYHHNLEEWIGNHFPALCGQRCDPDYAEWMMGWPLGWTDLLPLETDRFRLWQQQHLPCFHHEKPEPSAPVAGASAR